MKIYEEEYNKRKSIVEVQDEICDRLQKAMNMFFDAKRKLEFGFQSVQKAIDLIVGTKEEYLRSHNLIIKSDGHLEKVKK